jgi:hypothetical protein
MLHHLMLTLHHSLPLSSLLGLLIFSSHFILYTALFFILCKFAYKLSLKNFCVSYWVVKPLPVFSHHQRFANPHQLFTSVINNIRILC